MPSAFAPDATYSNVSPSIDRYEGRVPTWCQQPRKLRRFARHAARSRSPWARGRSLGAPRHPMRAVRRHFCAPRDQRLQLAEEAGTVVAQVLGHEVAGKLGLTRTRGLRLLACSRNRSPPPGGNCHRVVRTPGAPRYEPQALHVGASSRRLWPRLYGVARAVGSPKRGRRRQFHGKSANFCAAAGALGIGLVGHRVKGALDPIGLGSDPWSVLDPGRMCEDGGVSAHRFDHRDVEQVVSRLVFTAAYDPGVSVTSHTKFVTVWRGRNPLSHPRLFSQLPQQPFGAGVRGRAALPFGSTFRLPRRGRAENPSLCSPLRLQRPDLPLYPAGWMFWLTRKTFSGSKVALISASRS